jgi:hypothetical protein
LCRSNSSKLDLTPDIPSSFEVLIFSDIGHLQEQRFDRLAIALWLQGLSEDISMLRLGRATMLSGADLEQPDELLVNIPDN